jgi:hypothetical protein
VGNPVQQLRLFDYPGLPMTKTDLYAFLSRSRLGVLGTISRHGSLQSALVGIAATPEIEIVFDTVKTSRKYPNLIAKRLLLRNRLGERANGSIRGLGGRTRIARVGTASRDLFQTLAGWPRASELARNRLFCREANLGAL